MEKTEKKIFKKPFFKNKIKPTTVILAFFSVFSSLFLLWNASRTADQSNAISNIVTNTLKDTIEVEGNVPSIFEGTNAIKVEASDTDSDTQSVKINLYYLNLFVRKSAHLLGYTALSFFLTLTFISYGKKKDLSFISGIMLGVLNAVADETIQSFTDGRTGKLTDILLDTCGCIMGSFFAIVLIIFIYTVFKRREN